MEIEPTRPSWRRRLLAVALTAVALRALVVITFRFGSPGALDRIRRLNKRALNPLMLRFAGRSHWYAGYLEHVGRRSGRTYRTPVVAVPVRDGFAVPLPYGTQVDWLRNLLAAGTGGMKVKGVRYTVREPRVLDTSAVLEELPPLWRRFTRLYGFEHVLRVVATPLPPTGTERTEAGAAQVIEPVADRVDANA
jgi:deazaflavin-dependent oxidoreductase (nitroreductase family)